MYSSTGLRMTSRSLPCLRSCGKKMQVANGWPSKCIWPRLFLLYARSLHHRPGPVKSRLTFFHFIPLLGCSCFHFYLCLWILTFKIVVVIMWPTFLFQNFCSCGNFMTSSRGRQFASSVKFWVDPWIPTITCYSKLLWKKFLGVYEGMKLHFIINSILWLFINELLTSQGIFFPHWTKRYESSKLKLPSVKLHSSKVL